MTNAETPPRVVGAAADLRLPRWIVIWLCITAVIQTYDALFVILGPLSHIGGPLAGLWPGHLLYARFDHRYANFDAFGTAQSWANLAEVVVALIAVALRARFSGVILALILCVATFWKTVLYFAVEVSGGLEMTRDALERGDFAGFFFIAVFPNLFWLAIPLTAIVVLARQIARVGSTASARIEVDHGGPAPTAAPRRTTVG